MSQLSVIPPSGCELLSPEGAREEQCLLPGSHGAAPTPWASNEGLGVGAGGYMKRCRMLAPDS